jgi:hypothetical protein
MRFDLPPEGTPDFEGVMLAANDAARSLAELEQIPTEADAALATAAHCPGFPPEVLSSAAYHDARAGREARREQTAALRRDVIELLADSIQTFEEAHPTARAPADVAPRIRPAPRPAPAIGALDPLQAAGVVVKLVRWEAELTKQAVCALDDATRRLGEMLDTQDPENAALLERLRRFVQAMDDSPFGWSRGALRGPPSEGPLS